MSSETSTETPGLKPWQFFLLAGMLGATGSVIVATGQSPAAIVTLSLTVLSASFAGLGAYRTFLPLVSEDGGITPQLIGGRTRAALEREKSLVLRSIKELEFDFAMGKVARADFDEMSGRLRSRAIGLMRKLDAESSYATIIQREVEGRLGKKRAAPDTPSPAETPASPRDAQACSSCGVSNDVDARFCKSCGTRLRD